VGGFLGLGGSSYKTDRSMELAGFKDLSNIFNYGMQQGGQAIGAGQQNLGAAGNYYQQLLSGNRSAVSAAVAPETNAIRSATDASKRQIATSGSARGGGVNSTNQQVNDKSTAAVDNAIFAARPAAAQGATQVGGTELNAGTNLIGEAANSGANLTDLAEKARGQDYKINQDMVGKVTNFIQEAAGAIPGIPSFLQNAMKSLFGAG
jgi:hypothetical protein